MGDVINALPVVKALRFAHPDAEIVWMTLPRYKEIAECHYVDRVILCGTGRLGNGIPDEIMAREKFDLVLYPQASVHHDEWVAARVPLMDFMAMKCNVSLVDRKLEIEIDDATRKRVDDIFKKEKLRDGKAVAVSCKTLSCENWPRVNYRRLAKELGTPIILIGGSDDEMIEGAIDCRGYPIKMGIEIIRRCALYVGGDTGPTWMACCTPTPIIVFIDPVRKAWVHVGFKKVVPKNNIIELSILSNYGTVLRLCRKLLNNQGVTVCLAKLKAGGVVSNIMFKLHSRREGKK